MFYYMKTSKFLKNHPLTQLEPNRYHLSQIILNRSLLNFRKYTSKWHEMTKFFYLFADFCYSSSVGHERHFHFLYEFIQ